MSAWLFLENWSFVVLRLGFLHVKLQDLDCKKLISFYLFIQTYIAVFVYNKAIIYLLFVMESSSSVVMISFLHISQFQQWK